MPIISQFIFNFAERKSPTASHFVFYYIIFSTFSSIMVLNGILGLFNLGTGEIIIIAIVILLLFGGKKIPELMRGIGKGVRNFKDGLNDVTDEINKVDEKKPSTDEKK